VKWLALSLVAVILMLQYRLWLSDDGVREVARLSEAVERQKAENDELVARNQQMVAEVAERVLGTTNTQFVYNLAGNTQITAIGVGAHRAHLTVPSGLRGPIPCQTCHLVPTQVDDPGHIDSLPPAEVNDSLSWDRATRTCGTTNCHVASRPVWTARGGVFCGSCHGIPPADAPHTPTMTLTSCATCHSQSVDAFGAILLTTGPGGTTSKHMNGVVDVP